MSRGSWTEEEDAFIREHYASMTAREIAESLGRTVQSVRRRLNKMGLRKIAPWTEEEKAFVAAHQSWTTSQLARALNRSACSIRHARRAILGPQRSSAPWTEEQRAFIISHFASTPGKELARAVGRTASAVSTFAHALGLRKSAAYMAEVKERATAALRAASRSKPAATMAHIRALERCRIALGLPQKTRMKIGREPEAKGCMRRWLMSCGYVMMDGDRLTLYYTPDTARRPRSEATAARHGIRIKPIEDYGQNG